MSKEKIKSFCDEFSYPFIVLYGLEQAFLGVVEFWNGHKIACYDKDLLWKSLYDAGLPPDVVEEKLDNFYSFWEEIQKTDEVFKGKGEDFIKFHLPVLITRLKDGISPLLNNIVWEGKEDSEITTNLKEILEENEQKYRDSERTFDIIKETRELLDGFN